MERSLKRGGYKGHGKPDRIDARLAHARRHSTRRLKDKAERSFLRSLPPDF